jgi:hypothetical protein
MKFEIGLEVSPGVAMEFSKNGMAIVFYDIDAGEIFVPNGLGRKIFKVPRMTIIL